MFRKTWLREQNRLLTQLDVDTPPEQWGPSHDAVVAGRRAFAGRATSGVARGHDILVTTWVWPRRLRRTPPGTSIPLDAYDFCIDIYSPAGTPDVEIGEFDWTQLGRTLTEVLEWVSPYEVSWLPPTQAERARGWLGGSYDPDAR